MRILKISYILVLIIIINGCGLTNMANKYETVSFAVAPSTLETHGGKVYLSIDATFPEKYFAKQVTADFTLVLVYKDGEIAFKTITIQGEDATGGEATIFKKLLSFWIFQKLFYFLGFFDLSKFQKILDSFLDGQQT